jgi:hypothetical protein
MLIAEQVAIDVFLRISAGTPLSSAVLGCCRLSSVVLGYYSFSLCSCRLVHAITAPCNILSISSVCRYWQHR